jgi:hypothetical protein
MGDLAFRKGSRLRAAVQFRESLALYQAVPDACGIALALAGLADVIRPAERALRCRLAAWNLADNPPRVPRTVDGWELKECRVRLLSYAAESLTSAEPLDRVVADALSP